MATEILSAAVANTTASTTASTAVTQNGLDIGDYIGIVALVATAITFIMTYRHGSQSVRADTHSKREMGEYFGEL